MPMLSNVQLPYPFSFKDDIQADSEHAKGA